MNFTSIGKFGLRALALAPLLLTSCRSAEIKSGSLEQAIKSFEIELDRPKKELEKDTATTKYDVKQGLGLGSYGFGIAAMPLDIKQSSTINFPQERRRIIEEELRHYFEPSRLDRKFEADRQSLSRDLSDSNLERSNRDGIKSLVKTIKKSVPDEYKDELKRRIKTIPLIGTIYVGVNDFEDFLEDNVKSFLKDRIKMPPFEDWDFKPGTDRIRVEPRWRISKGIYFGLHGDYGKSGNGEPKSTQYAFLEIHF